MKAQVEASGTGMGGVRDGKVHKAKHHHHSHKEEENAEIKAYLSKLQELVPFMPKNRKLSKLEVITHVIDYIRDLRQTLGLPPCTSNNDFDMESASIISQVANPITLNVINNNTSSTSSNNTSSSSSTSSSHHPHQRQPLCPISNPNNVNAGGSYTTHEIPQLMDKSPSADVDTRPVSC